MSTDFNGGKRLKILLASRSVLQLKQTSQMLNRIRDCLVVPVVDVRAAIQHISQDQPDLIITDWTLEHLTAAELLQAIRTRTTWKEIPVIVCLDEISARLSVQAKNLGANNILTKPLSQILLSRTIAEIFPSGGGKKKDSTIINPSEIRAKLSRIDSLAPLSALAKSILAISNDPHSSAKNLAEEVKRDQSLTAKILQIVNSAFYGFHRQIGNIDHAIVVMGFDEVVNIALAASLLHFCENGRNFLFDRDKFWLHSIGSAYIARALSRYTDEVISKDAFVVGLLHDFGKVAMRQHFRDVFYRILAEAARRKQPLHHVSLELADIEHGEVGAMVADSWNLPIPLVNAIKYHHTPEQAGIEEKEVHLAHLANIFCHWNKIGKSGNTVPDDPSRISLKALGIEGIDLDEVWKSLKIDAQMVRSTIG